MIRGTTHPARHGFTLIEVLVSAAILSILLATASSIVALTAKSIPNGRGRASAITAAVHGLDMLSLDAACATSVSVLDPAEFELVVPDRNGDGTPETIAYAWSGTPGDPLVRRYNARSANVATNVSEFSLTYDRLAVPLPTTYTVGAEALLYSYDAASGLGDSAITSNNSRAEYFRPTLASGVTSWRVTRVMLKMRKHSGSNGDTRIQLRPSNGTTPNRAVFTEFAVDEDWLDSDYLWQSISYSDAPSVAAGTGLCLVVKWKRDDESCDVQYQTSGATAANAVCFTSSDNGSSWVSRPGQSLVFYVYGKVTTPDPTAYTYSLQRVRCTLRGGEDTTGRLNATIRMLNEPTVPGP
jgi:prepilin-type N-terminal cleavage/methylation domain-containing protein